MSRSFYYALLPFLTSQIVFAQAPKEGAVSAPILAESPANVSDLAPPAPSGAAPAKITYSSCTVEGNSISITFDDGPHAQNTPRLLDMLKQRGIRATFFVVGQNAAEYPEILKRIVAEGHEIANHSYSHPILASKPESGLRDELDKTHQAVLKATGVNMKVMRPPYGALSEPQRRWVRANFGYSVILWDVDPLDWKFRDAGRVEQEILGHTHAGSIILAHDIHKSTVDAMPATLDALVAKGFKFVTVSELLAMDKPGAAKPPAAPAAPKPVVPKPAKAAATKDADIQDVKEMKSVPVKQAAAAVPAKPKASEKSDGSDGDKTSSQKSPLSTADLRQKWLQITNQR
ncbi:MAG: polysaccharide deacetylase family protein [Verrucomicrobiota bacterium]